MDIDDSTPEKIEANDQACSREMEAVMEKWGRHMVTSCAAKTVKDIFGNIVGYCMVPVQDVKKKPPQPVAVEAKTEPDETAKIAGKDVASVL